MSTRIVFEFQQPPEVKDLALLVALAERFNASVVEELSFQNFEKNGFQRTTAYSSPTLDLPVEKFPKNLEEFALKPADLESLTEVFSDELPAETLCKMLTA